VRESQERHGKLTTAQRQAFEYVRAQALHHRPAARLILHDMAARWSIPPQKIKDAIISLEEQAQIVCHFHPDRILAEGLSVAEGLLRDERYRSQFETGVSNGILGTSPGSQRDVWETRLFGGAYSFTTTTPDERPKYGALDFLGYSDGAIPFFGSCYFVLGAAVARCCTFTFGDSSDGGEVGVVGAMDWVMAGLMRSVESGPCFGDENLSVPSLVSRLVHRPVTRPRTPGHQLLGRILQGYIEVQVHGTVDLTTDVEMLVADPSFRGTPTGEALKVLCSRFAIPLRWHGGFTLAADRVPDDFPGPLMEDFRGRRMSSLARRVANRGNLDAAILGRAAVSLDGRDEDRGESVSDEALLDINHLWYLLVHFGARIEDIAPGFSGIGLEVQNHPDDLLESNVAESRLDGFARQV
jgi:Protein of unknown function (DUF3626)